MAELVATREHAIRVVVNGEPTVLVPESRFGRARPSATPCTHATGRRVRDLPITLDKQL
jgi:hypothetical protein